MIEHRTELGTEPLPDIRAVTFSPSAHVSYELSRWSRSFVDSFINGMDIVPRFSVGQCETLRTEIVQTNYYTKVEQYLNKHKKTARVVNSFNQLLAKRGKNLLFKTNADEGSENQEGINTSLEQNVSKPDLRDQCNDITTLYPAGNIYWFVCDKFNKTDNKDFPKMLFEFIEQKLTDDTEESNEAVHTTKKLLKTWWKESKEKKNKAKLKKQKRCVVRHVDAKHFDRIILTRNVFSDHKLLNYFDLLPYVLERLGEAQITASSEQAPVLEC